MDSTPVSYNIYAYLQEHGFPPGWEDVCEKDLPIGKKAVLELIADNIAKASVKKPYRPAPGVDRALQVFFELPFDRVKVVIFGEAPYPKEGLACGVAFSTPGLVNSKHSNYQIYEECRRCYPELQPMKDGCLLPWVRQGILLVNIAPAVNLDKPKTYLNVFMPFNVRVIDKLKSNKSIVYWLMGNQAKRVQDIVGQGKNVLISGHPSTANTKGGFVGCRVPATINKRLAEAGKDPIDWSLG